MTRIARAAALATAHPTPRRVARTRRVAVLASLALVAALVPGASATAAPTGTTADDGALPAAARDDAAPARTPRVLSRTGLPRVDAVSFGIPSAQKLLGLRVFQDVPAKTITITGQYSEPPTAEANTELTVLFGTWDANRETCTWAMAVNARAHASSSAARAEYTDQSSAGTATRAQDGSTVTVTLTGGAAGNEGYECLYGNVVDTERDADGELVLLAASLHAEFKPVIEEAPRIVVATNTVNAAYPGRWTPVRITVRNGGERVAKAVRLKVSGKKLTFRSTTLKVGKLTPGQRKDVFAKVRLKGKKTRTLKVKATAKGGWTAQTTTAIGYRRVPTKPKSLVGKRYWVSYPATKHTERSPQVRGLVFVSKKWVYLGLPARGGVPKCSSKVKECKKYSYHRAKGRLKIGRLRATVDSEGIQVTKPLKKGDRKDRYEPLQGLKKKSKVAVKATYWSTTGQCTFGTPCSTWEQPLTLRKNGTFVWGRSYHHTIGYGSNQTFISGSDPDKVGTYKVLSTSRIRFTYVDAETGKKTKETYTIGIDPDALGRYSLKNALLIGAMPHT